jgi:hypothetical protein
MRGGSYTDGASYGMYVNGTTGSQWSRTMDQSGPYGQVQGNVIIGAQGQNVTPVSQIPSGNNLNLIQSAGRRRRRGGFLGEVINQAVVPFALLGAQQSYGRKRKGGKTHKKRGGFIGELVNQAVVPFALLGAQQSYGRKRKGGKTRRHH